MSRDGLQGLVFLVVCFVAVSPLAAQSGPARDVLTTHPLDGVFVDTPVPASDLTVLEERMPLARLIRFSGVLDPGQDGAGLRGMTFILYADRAGTSPLWMETQNVAVDAGGHYSVLLGAETAGGVPAELFTQGEARWLGVVMNDGGAEQRVALASFPYAVSAGNAERLGGRPASDFLSAQQFREELRLALAELHNEDPSLPGADSAMTLAPTAKPGDKPGNQPGGGPSSPPPTNQEILDQIAALAAILNDQVLPILNEPEPMFSFQLCTEPAFQGELEAGSQMKLDGEIEGRVGAEGFGNGAMIKLKGAPAQRLEGKVKGAWDFLKLGMCWDIGATVRNRQAAVQSGNPSPLRAATLNVSNTPDLADIIGGLDQNMLVARMQALADKLQFNPADSINALEALGDLSPGNGPFAALRGEGMFSQLGQNLPLPPNLRTLLQNPGSLLTQLQEMRGQGLCNLDLPPAMSGPIGEICGLIANEPFKQLLDRVDGVTGNVRTRVTNLQNRVEDIRDRVISIRNIMPGGSGCLFSC